MRPTLLPCGACRALVPSDTGCGHWFGLLKRDYRAQQIRREENRQYRLAAQERLKQDIEAFHKRMGYGEQ